MVFCIFSFCYCDFTQMQFNYKHPIFIPPQYISTFVYDCVLTNLKTFTILFSWYTISVFHYTFSHSFSMIFLTSRKGITQKCRGKRSYIFRFTKLLNSFIHQFLHSFAHSLPSFLPSILKAKATLALERNLVQRKYLREYRKRKQKLFMPLTYHHQIINRRYREAGCAPISVSLPPLRPQTLIFLRLHSQEEACLKCSQAKENVTVILANS